jgi:hypothetical protein
MHKGYIARVTGRPIQVNASSGYFWLTLPSRIVKALQAHEVVLPSNMTITVTLTDEGKPRITIDGFEPRPYDKPLRRKRYKLPEGYGQFGHGSCSTERAKRFGNRLWTQEQSERQGLNWEEGT